MKKQELELRVEKIKVKIEKIEKRIKKWESKNNLDSLFENYNNMKWLTKEEILERFEESYFKNVSNEIRYAKTDLDDYNNRLKKYTEEINKIINFEKENKIQVIVDFLEDWRNKSYNWYIKNAELYIKLEKEYDKELENYTKAYKEKFNYDKLDWRQSSNLRYKFEQSYYGTINSLTKSLVSHYKINITKLNDILEEEVKKKYIDLVKRCTKVVGEILNADKLRIDSIGEINGIIQGTISNAKVRTITAGGYNIQCFHYRVLVNKI